MEPLYYLVYPTTFILGGTMIKNKNKLENYIKNFKIFKKFVSCTLRFGLLLSIAKVLNIINLLQFIILFLIEFFFKLSSCQVFMVSLIALFNRKISLFCVCLKQKDLGSTHALYKKKILYNAKKILNIF